MKIEQKLVIFHPTVHKAQEGELSFRHVDLDLLGVGGVLANQLFLNLRCGLAVGLTDSSFSEEERG